MNVHYTAKELGDLLHLTPYHAKKHAEQSDEWETVRIADTAEARSLGLPGSTRIAFRRVAEETSPRSDIDAADVAQARAWRQAGAPYDRVATETGHDADDLATAVDQQLSDHPREQGRAAIELEIQRLDLLQAKLWARAMSGDDDAAVDRILAVMDRRVRLLAELDSSTRDTEIAQRADCLQTEEQLLEWHRGVLSGELKLTRMTPGGKNRVIEYGETAKTNSARAIERIMAAIAVRNRDYIPRVDVQRVLTELTMLVRDRLRIAVTRGLLRLDEAAPILDELADESQRRWGELIDG